MQTDKTIVAKVGTLRLGRKFAAATCFRKKSTETCQALREATETRQASREKSYSETCQALDFRHSPAHIPSAVFRQMPHHTLTLAVSIYAIKYIC